MSNENSITGTTQGIADGTFSDLVTKNYKDANGNTISVDITTRNPNNFKLYYGKCADGTRLSEQVVKQVAEQIGASGNDNDAFFSFYSGKERYDFEGKNPIQQACSTTKAQNQRDPSQQDRAALDALMQQIISGGETDGPDGAPFANEAAPRGKGDNSPPK